MNNPAVLKRYGIGARPVATAEIGSLAAFGFPQAVIDAWAGDIPRLNQLQLDAINEFGILRGEHVASAHIFGKDNAG